MNRAELYMQEVDDSMDSGSTHISDVRRIRNALEKNGAVTLPDLVLQLTAPISAS